MIIRLISGALILFTAYMGLKHGWQLFNIKGNDTGPEIDIINKLNASKGILKSFAIFTMISSILILFPQTFFVGNILNAVGFVIIMAALLNIREIKPALIEIPFLIMPLLLIYLKHPFAMK